MSQPHDPRSLPVRSPSRRAVLRTVLAAGGMVVASTGVAVSLSGCGFRPVYGEYGRGGADLHTVSVAPIADRGGQILRNALLDRLRPGKDTPHELRVTFELVDQDLGIDEDDKASIKTLHGRASWKLLTRVADGRQRQDLDQRSRAAVTYNILDSQYATERNRRAARKAIAEQIAADIEMRLAAYFATHGTNAHRASGKPKAYPGF